MCLTISSKAGLSFILKSIGISLVLAVSALSEGEETGDWHLARMGEVCTIMLFLRSV